MSSMNDSITHHNSLDVNQSAARKKIYFSNNTIRAGSIILSLFLITHLSPLCCAGARKRADIYFIFMCCEEEEVRRKGKEIDDE